MQTGRTEHRMATNTVASLESVEAPAIHETVVFVNISEHGAPSLRAVAGPSVNGSWSVIRC